MTPRRSLVLLLVALPIAGCGSGGKPHPRPAPAPARTATTPETTTHAGGISVFPSAGTRLASPTTQISFRGRRASELGHVEVSGSKTGGHKGRLEPDSDDRGASFFPSKPFVDGETVSVRLRGRVVDRFSITAPAAVALPPQQASSERVNVARFRSRPDLHPTGLKVDTSSPSAAPGDIFVAPKAGESQGGPMILDSAGRMLWFHPNPGDQQAFDFRVQRYQGKPVLTWWQGDQRSGFGRGQGLIYSSGYRQVGHVRAGNGYMQDMHEFKLTSHGTALLDAYNPVHEDLSAAGGPKNGLMWDAVVQEIDVKTGNVLFEWHSLDHVPIADAIRGAQKNKIYDYFHVNSVDEMPNGDLLVSSRDTSAVYEIDRSTGQIVWRLGGKHSTFAMGPGTAFRWQHDARPHGGDEISIFDNDAVQLTHHRITRGLVIHLDEAHKRATLVHAYTHPSKLLSPSQGNLQLLPDGHAFMGWGGNNNRFSEFSKAGKLLFDESFTSSKNSSYRAFREPWEGRPADSPAAAARTVHGKTTVYASWNGATDIASWRVLSGASQDALQAGPTKRRADFETAIPLPAKAGFVQVEALDRAGNVLGRSPVVAAKSG